MNGYLVKKPLRIKVDGKVQQFRRGDQLTGDLAELVKDNPLLRARCIPKTFPDPQPAPAKPAPAAPPAPAKPAAPAPAPAQEK